MCWLAFSTTSAPLTASIVTCRDAYTALSNQWAGLIDSMALSAGRQLYPRQTAALAKTKLLADLPVAYQYLSGVSKNASDIFRQVLTINAMNQAMHGFAGASGTSSIDVSPLYAVTVALRGHLLAPEQYPDILQTVG